MNEEKRKSQTAQREHRISRPAEGIAVMAGKDASCKTRLARSGMGALV